MAKAPACALARGRERSPYSAVVRVPDEALEEVAERGFAVVEGFLAPDELTAAQRALWLHFPKPAEYFANPARFSEYATSQFAGVEEFPYRSWDLNRLAFHPDLVDAAERYLGTEDLHLYKVELWAKYSGAVNYDQPLHRDYGSHSLVVPRRDGRYQQMTTFVFLSDVTEDDGPTRIVPDDVGQDIPFTPLYFPPGPLIEVEVPATGAAGSLLMYRSDILHRGSNFTGVDRARFSLLADYQQRGATWGNAPCASVTSSDGRARATTTGMNRRSPMSRPATPASTWRRTTDESRRGSTFSSRHLPGRLRTAATRNRPRPLMNLTR